MKSLAEVCSLATGLLDTGSQLFLVGFLIKFALKPAVL